MMDSYVVPLAPLDTSAWEFKSRILNECSRFIDFIKQVVEKRLNARLAKQFIFFFCNKFNKFNKTKAQMLGSIHHMT